MPTDAPGVLLLSDGGGGDRAAGERLTAAGFVVRVVPPELAASGGSEREALARLEDLAASLGADDRVDPERVGAIGFGAAGTRALLLACTSSRLAAVVLFQAPVAASELSAERPFPPLEMILNLTAPLQAHYGDADPALPRAEVEALRTALAQGAKTFELELHSGAGAGFFDPAASGYHAPSADAAWNSTLRFLAEYLEG